MTPTFKIAERDAEGLFDLLPFSFESYHDAKIYFDEISVGKCLRDFTIMQAIWSKREIVPLLGEKGYVYEITGWTFE